MRVLVTNDDGVLSPGLHALAAAVVGAGHEPLVVAPSEDHSGCGGSIGPLASGGRIEYRRVTLPGGLPALAVEGPPALCVISACLGGFGARPDAVVSGVNPGNNTGRVVLHSGTVSAALTALTFGVPGLAVSLALSRPMRWDVAAEAALAPLSLLTQLPQPQALSINLPELGERLPRGVRAAHLAEAGIVQAIVAEPEEGALELTVPAQEGLDPSSDTALVHDGYATVTLLAGLERVRGDDQHVAAALVASCFEREAATA